MIRLVDIESKPHVPTAGGHVRNVLDPATDRTRVRVAVEDVGAGKTSRVTAADDRTQVAYILEGHDATIAYTTAGRSTTQTAQRRTGIYLEPGDEATFTAAST